MNILIAEDDQITQLFYQKIMQDWDYSCDIAGNGLKAVELTQQNKGQYDFCIMDINMPYMNGLEAAMVIRKMGYLFTIVGCSSDESLKEKCFKAGMDAFIEKPFHFDQLSCLVNQVSTEKSVSDIRVDI